MKDILRFVWPHFSSEKFAKPSGSSIYKKARDEFNQVIFNWGARDKRVGPKDLTTYRIDELRRKLRLENMNIAQTVKVSDKFFEASIKLDQKNCSGILPLSKMEYKSLKNIEENNFVVLKKDDYDSLKHLAE